LIRGHIQEIEYDSSYLRETTYTPWNASQVPGSVVMSLNSLLG